MKMLLKQLTWLIVIWTSSVMVLGLIALGFRLLMNWAGFR